MYYYCRCGFACFSGVCASCSPDLVMAILIISFLIMFSHRLVLYLVRIVIKKVSRWRNVFCVSAQWPAVTPEGAMS